MTVQEAKEILEYYEKQEWFFEKDQPAKNAFSIAIKCMEELEQYRALGTVEEIKKKIQTELPYMSLAQARFKSELDEYRNLGTVEELKEAREKQIPKKPHKYIAFDGIERNGCPRCYEELGRNEILYAGQKYCSVCGQALKRR